VAPAWVGFADALARRDTDILVLSEYRGGKSAARLLAALDALAYRYVTKLAAGFIGSG
jgi:hypothetical protein